MSLHKQRLGRDMGFKISWIGFRGKAKTSVLEAVGLNDTGEPDMVNETPFSGAEIPGGWYILFSNDFGFVSGERLARLSVDCQVVACQVHEGMMFSAAYGYEPGNRVWELTHDSDEGVDDLSIFGSPPPSFESIRSHLAPRQEEAPGDLVDYIFDVPVEVAAAVCSYRHDRLQFGWGMPKFTRLSLLQILQ